MLTIDRYRTEDELAGRIAHDVGAGLADAPRELPPKYFYDGRGSELFEEITRLPEYYPTRAETAILETLAGPFMARLAPRELVEIGSGSSRKTRLLIEAMHDAGGNRYVGFDVSEDAVRAAAKSLRKDYPWLEVHGVIGDFDRDLRRIPRGPRRCVAFLGSTIGNIRPSERTTFLRSLRSLLQDDDRLLLGVDLVKDSETLERAYDDSAGVTAEFNKNVLAVINAELDADFDLDQFDHVARWDPDQAWIEMALRTRTAQTVHIPGAELELRLEAGEEIRTEISCKFTRESVEQAFAGADLEIESWNTDPRGLFALVVARPR